jgi:hypothetical protein
MRPVANESCRVGHANNFGGNKSKGQKVGSSDDPTPETVKGSMASDYQRELTTLPTAGSAG